MITFNGLYIIPGSANLPKPRVLITPDEDGRHLYERLPIERGDLYISSRPNGIVHYYLHVRGNMAGLYGDAQILHMKDGSTVSIKGLWSSSAQEVNQILAQAKDSRRVIEVIVGTPPAPRGGTALAFNGPLRGLTVEKMGQIIPEDLQVQADPRIPGYYKVIPRRY